jgi:integrase
VRTRAAATVAARTDARALEKTCRSTRVAAPLGVDGGRGGQWDLGAWIALMVFSFARIGAALGMRVEDVYTQGRRLWVRLREKGGKRHEMPCHRTLEAYLHAYIDGTGIGDDPKRPLFRTGGRGTRQLTRTPLHQANAYAMVQRRAEAAGISTRIGNHTFRATGITACLKNGGTLENAAAMANHASTRTTQLYNRRRDEISLGEVERIRV